MARSAAGSANASITSWVRSPNVSRMRSVMAGPTPRITPDKSHPRMPSMPSSSGASAVQCSAVRRFAWPAVYLVDERVEGRHGERGAHHEQQVALREVVLRVLEEADGQGLAGALWHVV